MRIFAFNLPQFHEITENNEWWGEGFTEWVNVKSAKSMYKGHIQPKRPLNDYYYNLLEKDTMIWQNSLLKEYGLTGMVYYHYYFCGKKLLEKPVENLLKWKDIEQPFFFCWANHTWNRSWNGTKEILLEQTYGGEDDWDAHFEYLLPFFLDARYEKIENKPVFMLYKPNFSEKKEMFDFFERKCKENGFDGIYLIETCIKINSGNLDKIQANKAKQCEKIFLREPNVSQMLFEEKYYKSIFSHFVERLMRRLKSRLNSNLVNIMKGDILYDLMIKEEPTNHEFMRGVFFEWDNTPRHSNRGYVIEPVCKSKFFEYMNLISKEDYCIVNAWNEWAEGMMLEPTEENRYKYLEWIKEWQIKN